MKKTYITPSIHSAALLNGCLLSASEIHSDDQGIYIPTDAVREEDLGFAD